MNSKKPPTSFLIVDDEELARKELHRPHGGLLPSFHGLEAANVQQAREILLGQQVDAVFLDLEMPGGHGIQFLPEVRAMGVPVIITTAHDHFAVNAFDGDAADYLLKPIETGRLARALARIRQPGRGPESGLVVLGDQSHCWPLQPEEIVLAESEGSYVTIHLKEGKPIVLTRSLRDIEHLLPENLFVRVNRSQIVQLACLRFIRRKDGGGFAADLTGHGPIEFSRRQAQAFRQRYGF
jgi:two-component system LytT family response regulator